MKIMIFNSLYQQNAVGGAEVSVRILSEALKLQGADVVVVSLIEPHKPAKISEINGIKIYFLPLQNSYWPFAKIQPGMAAKSSWHLRDIYNWRYRKFLLDILATEKPDVVHTNNLVGFSVYIWRLCNQLNIPIVHTLRDYYLLCYRSTCFHNNRNCAKLCSSCYLASRPKRFFSKYVNSVVGISDFILTKHLQYGYFSQAKKTVIANSVELPANYKARSYGNGKLRLGFMGRLTSEKGVEVLLQACHDVDNIELIVAGVGDATYVDYLRSKYNELSCRFVGVMEPAKFYSEIDLLVTPSLWGEPFGRVIIEANGYGVPVLGAKRGGIPELIVNGKNGYLFTSREELRKLIFAFAQHELDYTAMSKAARAMSEKYAAAKIAEQYMELYSEI